MFETCAEQRQVIYNTIKTDGWETFLTEDYCVGKILFQVCYNFTRKLAKESNTLIELLNCYNVASQFSSLFVCSFLELENNIVGTETRENRMSSSYLEYHWQVDQIFAQPFMVPEMSS